MIFGVLLTPLKRIEGAAGDVLHGLKASAPGYAGFGEAYFSEIHEGAVKSWRRHSRVTVNLIVPVGQVRFAVHDEAQQQTEGYELGARRNYARLTIAPGIWFAFKGAGPGSSLILSIIDREHDPAESESRELATIPYSW
jgi:dTDP-4-dehydrorhamnose 3,5-epimerase